MRLSTRIQFTVFAACLFAANVACFADDEDGDKRMISVTGTTVTRIVPDVIVWHITTNDTHQELISAKGSSDAKMESIMSLKDALKVDPKDVQTGYLSVQKIYERDRNGNRTSFKHFQVSRNVTLKQHDLKRFDEFLTNLVSSAEMDVHFSYESTLIHDVRAQTRLKALAAAREKAEAMSKALGAKLGQVMTISEDQPGDFSPIATSNSAFFNPRGPLPEDVSTGTFAPGAIESRVSVHVVFELE